MPNSQWQLRLGRHWLSFALVLAAFIIWFSGAGQTSHGPKYLVIDIGPANDIAARACAINSTGDVALQVDFDGNAHKALKWDPALHRGTSLDSPGSRSEYVYSLNDNGMAAGYVVENTSDRACIWNRGKRLEIGIEHGGFGHAYGINNRGDAVGTADISGRCGVAFLWRDGKLAALPGLTGRHNCAYGVNDSGDAVGYAMIARDGVDYLAAAVVWHSGAVSNLGVLGVAYAINNRGVVVGTEDSAAGDGVSASRGFVWQSGETRLLSSLGGRDSFAYALNSDEDIVGAATTSAGKLHAALWRGSSVIDLNSAVGTSPWELLEARGINAKGQIVGVGLLGGKQHAFLLTPTSPTVPDSGKGHDASRSDNIGPTYFMPQALASSTGALAKSRLGPVSATYSIPVVFNDVECQTIVQAEWRLPEKNDRGNLSNWRDWQEVGNPTSRLAAFGQTDLLLAMRFTNRGTSPIYLQLLFMFQPEMTPLTPGARPPKLGNSIPPNVRGLAYSPLLSPGQSFTVSRPARLAWYGKDLWFECLSVPGETTVKGLSAGRYSLTLWVSDQSGGIYRKDSPYKTMVGEAELNKVIVEIR